MRKAFLILTVFISVPLGAATRKLPITADVGICAHPREVHLNTGANSHIRIKGNEHYYLFNFDAASIKHWKIGRATLHLKLARGRLRRVALCTVPVAWTEGTATNKPQTGSPCYTHVKYPTQAWTRAGGTMLDATFNSPYMMWRAGDVKYKGQWMEIPVEAKLIQAVAAGLSHGLVLADEKGQTRENHDVYTREQANARPYLVVECNPPLPKTIGSRPPAKAAPFPPGAGFDTGAILVSAGFPGETFGNEVKLFEKTAGGGKGKLVGRRVSFREDDLVFAGLRPAGKYLVHVNSCLKQGGLSSTPAPSEVVASAALPTPKAPKLAPAESLPSVARAGWMVRLRSVSLKPLHTSAGGELPAIPIPVTARNAWVGLQAVITPPGGKAAGVAAELAPLRYAGKQKETPPPLKQIRLYRTWLVPSGKSYHAEVLVPLKKAERFAVPWAQNKVPSQRNQAIFIDVFAGKNAVPGPYEGKLSIRQDGKVVLAVPIKLVVSGVTLADEFHIAGDMNTYGSPAGAMGLRSSDAEAFMAMERKYYRLAHSHRMTLNVLPYSQSGGIGWRGAPKIAGQGRKCKVTDWSQWDRRYGPLLSGSAFGGRQGYVGPGQDTPIRHMYLPLHENWPSKLADHFRPWPPPKDYQKFLLWTAGLPPIEKSLDGAVASAWTAVLRQFSKHLDARRWDRTRYQVYLNNKYYFRRDGGRGISLWLLDEPMYADDFLALAHFGDILHRLKQSAYRSSALSKIGYRIDISRPTHQRKWLDGRVDLNVCADQLYSQRRLIEYRRRKFGEEYWNYRMPPSFITSNIDWAVWPVRSFCWGATGTLPWQTIASDGDLYKADATALMYPSRKFGLNEPLASLRMKAWRQGLQDAELLRMLKARGKYNDVQLRAWVGQICGLSGWKGAMDPKSDSPIVTFSGISDQKLSALRRAALEALAKK
ncbi:MAG: DUF4091 domain-containing protein [Phycisphaerae bacterium]|nr:DUF4091 domain-containing protein [Phycisphaerae bacterium]